MVFHKWLTHPKLAGISQDNPRTTLIRREIVNENKFLQKIYLDWYDRLRTSLPEQSGKILELGTGAGFLADHVPDLITSDVFYLPFVKLILDGQKLPFVTGSLRAILMSDVLHHIQNPRDFFNDAARCVQPGGVISMVEPWVSGWSRIIYTHLHKEPLQPDIKEWTFPSAGPLSGANSALPWILFKRDIELFRQEFPIWKITTINPFMPFRYLVSGGVSMRPIMPGWSYPFWAWIETCFSSRMDSWAMFAHITLTRQ